VRRRNPQQKGAARLRLRLISLFIIMKTWPNSKRFITQNAENLSISNTTPKEHRTENGSRAKVIIANGTYRLSIDSGTTPPSTTMIPRFLHTAIHVPTIGGDGRESGLLFSLKLSLCMADSHKSWVVLIPRCNALCGIEFQENNNSAHSPLID